MFLGESTSFFFTVTSLLEKKKWTQISIQDPASKNSRGRIDSEERGKEETDFILRTNEGTELGRFKAFFSWRNIYARFYLPDSPEPIGDLKQGWAQSFSFNTIDGKKLYELKSNWNEKIRKVISLLLEGKPEVAVATKMEDKMVKIDYYPFKLEINPTTEQDTRILLMLIFPVMFEIRVR